MWMRNLTVVGICICLVAWSSPALAACQSDDDCGWGETCVNGSCMGCVPDCEGKVCGDDGCGGSCGSCPPGVICVANQCPCSTNCAGKECGIDGCGGYCGNGNAAQEGCSGDEVCENGICGAICVPDCSGVECGSDGCSGSCGTCPCVNCEPDEIVCSDGHCQEPLSCDCSCIFDCFDTCPEGDQACFQNCVNAATIEAQMNYNALIVCLDESGYFDCPAEDDVCLNETFDECLDEYYVCFSGDMECVELYLCLFDCPGGAAGDDCAQDCFASGTPDALNLWDVFIECLDDEEYFDCPDSDDACLDVAWGACQTAFSACAHGDLSCAEAYNCIDGCQAADNACGLSCFLHGTVKAQQSMDVLFDCVEIECGNGAAPDCEDAALEGSCGAAYQACIGGTCAVQCSDNECGDDGCGGSCGSCAPGELCEQGQCSGPAPDGDVVTEKDVIQSDGNSSPDSTTPPAKEEDMGETGGHTQSGCSGTPNSPVTPFPALLLALILVLGWVRQRRTGEQQ
jgi:MYXO-CTERM domain-containing protein